MEGVPGVQCSVAPPQPEFKGRRWFEAGPAVQGGAAGFTLARRPAGFSRLLARVMPRGGVRRAGPFGDSRPPHCVLPSDWPGLAVRAAARCFLVGGLGMMMSSSSSPMHSL